MKANIRVEDSKCDRPNRIFNDSILVANFDDGSKGFYILDDKHHVRIWVNWKK